MAIRRAGLRISRRDVLRRSAIATGSFAWVGMLAGCTGSTPAADSPTHTATPTATPTVTPKPAASTVRVAIPNDRNLQWMNFWVAQGAGLFEDEGVEVEIVVPPRPPATARFMAKGQADAAVVPRPIYLDTVAQGEPVLAFANLFANDPINLVVQPEVAEERGLSMEMPLEERLAGLEGLKIGLAPGPPVRLRTLLASVDLDADSHIEMVILHGGEQNGAFGDGSVDALYAHTPFLERALVKQDAVMLVDQAGGEVPELAGRQYHTLVTTQDYTDSNPEDLVSMARAILQAQQLVHADQGATVEAIRASDVKLQFPEGLETIVAIYAPAIPRTPEVSVEAALRELELYPSHRDPPDLSDVDMSQHVDNRFAQQAMESDS